MSSSSTPRLDAQLKGALITTIGFALSLIGSVILFHIMGNLVVKIINSSPLLLPITIPGESFFVAISSLLIGMWLLMCSASIFTTLPKKK